MNADATPTLPLYLRVLWRRKWALLLPVVLATVAAYGLAKSERPVYEAYTDLLFRSLESSGGVPSQPADIPTEQRIATSPAVAEGAAKNLGDGTPAEAILAQVGALQVDQLAILRITAHGPSPDNARQVVTAVSAAYLDFRRERDAQNAGTISAAVARQTKTLSDELERLDQQITGREARGGGGAPADDAETDDSQLQALRARRDSLLGQLAVSQGRLDQLNLQTLTQGNEVTVIVPTTSSEVPIEPQPKRAAAIGGLLGLLVGFGLVLVREQLNRGVRNVDELEQAVGASVRSTIPRVPSWRRRKEARLIMMENALSPTAEAYRILQSSLAFLEVGTSAKVLLLTSATPGEGKSTTAANLAVAFAEAGVPTALVDADLRHPRLHKFFKVDNRSGLSDILTGRATFDQVVQAGGWHQSESGLALLTAGRPLSHPTRALTSPTLTTLLARLGQSSLVILDAPPTLPVADTAMLAAHADAVLVVANPSVASRPALEQLGRRLPSLGTKVLGIVLNAPEPNRMPAEAYTYHYAYSAADPDRVQPSRAQRSRRRRTSPSNGGWR